MKKKMLAVLLALLVIPATLFATPIFQVGPLVSYNKTIAEIQESGSSQVTINNFSFGADLRLNMGSWVSLDIPFTLGFGEEWSTSIATIPTLNLNIPATGFMDIAIGLGPQLDFQYVGHTKTWTMNGLPIESFADAFMKAKLAYRAGLTFNISFISISANVFVPAEGAFNCDDIGKIFLPQWSATRFAAAVLFNFG